MATKPAFDPDMAKLIRSQFKKQTSALVKLG